MTNKCKWCKGRGVNPAEYGPVPCPDCEGTGYELEDELDDDEERETEGGDDGE